MSILTNSYLNKIENWILLENTRHGIQPRENNPLATFSEFPEKYRPGADPYEMTFYEVPEQNCILYKSSKCNKELAGFYFKDADRVLFPVHPVNLNNEKIAHIKNIVKNPFQNISVRPTSSTRTVYVLDQKLPPHCVKPHTDLHITKWRRHMSARKVAHAVAITKIFERSSTFKMNPKISYFPESIGVIYKGNDLVNKEVRDRNWGFIVREMESQPLLKKPYKMIPLNSLYIPDPENPQEPPILVKMIQQSNKNPKEFILEEMIYPLIKAWSELYLETGVLLEPHGQNVIVEIDDSTGEIIRFAHRDFDCDINLDIARKNGFAQDESQFDMLNCFSDNFDNSEDPAGSHLSARFDNSVKVPLDAIAQIGERFFQIPQADLREACQQYLNTHLQEFLKQFPLEGKTYDYSRVNDAVILVEKEPPQHSWRKILKNQNFSDS